MKHESATSSPSSLNDSLRVDKLWGPSQRVVTLFYHIWLYSMITYPPTGEPRWCRKMPTGATYRAAQNCNGMFSKTLVPGNNRKKTITGLSNKHHCQDFVWCLVNTTLRIWPGSKHQKISVRLLLILSSFSLPRGSAGKTNRGDCGSALPRKGRSK